MTAPAPATARPALTRRAPRAGLNSGALSVRAWLMLAAGTAGGLAFTGVYLAEGATRAGYRALAQPISALSLGPGRALGQVYAGERQPARRPGGQQQPSPHR